MEKELQHLPVAIRELQHNPNAVISETHKLILAQAIFEHPGNTPHVEIFQLVVTDLLSSPERMAELEKTPFKPVVVWLKNLSQISNEYLDYKNKLAADAENGATAA
jgi:hypothetical protein